MITRFEAENFFCLKKVALDLQPIHALIGPNDSGKSTLLRAMRTLASHAAQKAALPMPAGSALRASSADGAIQLRAAGSRPPSLERSSGAPPILDGGARFVRWDAARLKEPSGLVPENVALNFGNEHGSGLPGVLQSIQGRGDDSFVELRTSVLARFPTLRSLGVSAQSISSLVLRAQLLDGTLVDAHHMSEGLLYYTAYLALRHLSPVPLLLVEEPENGLHPSRIADVVGILRTLSEQGTQVVIATHSPLVINELAAEEVTLVTRPSNERGTVLTPMTATKDFERRSKTYALGELWLSYADGNTESELVP